MNKNVHNINLKINYIRKLFKSFQNFKSWEFKVLKTNWFNMRMLMLIS